MSGAIEGAVAVYSTVDGSVAFIDADYHEQPGSASIDAGDPADASDLEPGPNGGRVNQGAYGNTAEAASSLGAGKTAGGAGAGGSCGLTGLEGFLLLGLLGALRRRG